MEYKKDKFAYTVACDTEEQCTKLEALLDEMQFDYRFVYVFVPEDKSFDDGEFGEYFDTLKHAEGNARISAWRYHIDCPVECDSLETTYVFYKIHCVTWVERVHCNDDVRKYGTKIKKIKYTTEIKKKETYL